MQKISIASATAFFTLLAVLYQPSIGNAQPRYERQEFGHQDQRRHAPGRAEHDRNRDRGWQNRPPAYPRPHAQRPIAPAPGHVMRPHYGDQRMLGRVPAPPPRHMARGVGPRHDWFRGHYLPPQYRAPRYVVNDWQYRQLPQPPYGQQWMRVNNDYVLVAVATGMILSFVLGY